MKETAHEYSIKMFLIQTYILGCYILIQNSAFCNDLQCISQTNPETCVCVCERASCMRSCWLLLSLVTPSWWVMSSLKLSVYKRRWIHWHQAVTHDPLRCRTEGDLQCPLWTIMKGLFSRASSTSHGIFTQVYFNAPPLHPLQSKAEDCAFFKNHLKKTNIFNNNSNDDI